MKQKRKICISAAIAAAVICASFLEVIRAQTPSPSIWKHIELYNEGRSEFRKGHYEKALKDLVEFRDANEDLLDSSTLSQSQIKFRDTLDATIDECESKQNQRGSRPMPSASVHSRDASKA